MSISIIQLPPDFEERYKAYRFKLGDKHTERALNVVAETQERAVRDLAIVSGQMEVFANNFSALSIIQEEIKRSDETVASIQKTIEANERFFQTMISSMGPVLNVARDAQMQIERLGIGKTLEQLRDPIEKIISRTNEIQRLINNQNVVVEIPIKVHYKLKEKEVEKKETDTTFNNQLTELIGIAKSIEEKMPVQKITSGSKFPFKIPAGTRWESIIIQFTSSDYVNIQVAGRSHPTGYADMGFVDNRTQKPNFQWAFLLVLAKNNGLLSPSSPDANEKYKKQKQMLSERLQEYFSIDFDPFETYSKEGYKVKMTLIPPVQKSEEKKPESISDEVQKMFDEYRDE